LSFASDAPSVALTLVLFCSASMLAAAGVLYASAGSRMLRAASMQGLFPLLTWVSWAVL